MQTPPTPDAGATANSPPAAPSAGGSATATAFSVVGIGASAGGLEALTELLQHLPPHPGVALVLVLHLAPHRESQLAKILARATPLPVAEAQDGQRVQPDHVYIIPPSGLLAIAGGVLRLQPRHDSPAGNMPIDHFLRSLADDQASRAIGVILSGGGTDGTLGLQAIKAAGGFAFAQSETSARQAGMPHSAIAGGCVDAVLPPASIAQELARIGSHPEMTAAHPAGLDLPTEVPASLATLFGILRAWTGLDFSQYRQSLVRRRLERYLLARGLASVEELLPELRANPANADALFQDLVVRATRFFHDPDAYAALQQTAFPALLRNRPAGEPVRIWVVGCATGEEVYALAICLLEFLGDRAASTPIKILATDVNEEALAQARSGVYLDNISADVTPARLRCYFQKLDHGYRVVETLRNLCVFARHNLAEDPPFSHLDLICCRDILPALEDATRAQVVPRLHFALEPGGFLLLGPSESVEPFQDYFHAVDHGHRLFVRTLVPSLVARPGQEPTAVAGKAAPAMPLVNPAADHAVNLLALQREADRVHLQYAPVGVLVDAHLNVLQFRGRTSPYLRLGPGVAKLDLLSLAHEGLLGPLRDCFREAQQQGAARREGVRFLVEGQWHSVTLQVAPLRLESLGQPCYLALFLNERPASPAAEPPPAAVEPPGQQTVASERDVEQEFVAAREHLHAVIAEYEATNEELKSINEELVVSNEELQTAYDQLRATQGQLQATGVELQQRNAELAQLNDDLLNLLAGIHIPILMVTRDLRVRRFTADARKLFQLIPGDVGRPLDHLQWELAVPDLIPVLREVIDTLQVVEREVQDREGHWYSLRVRPYATTANQVEGAVLTVIDIDPLKRSEQQLRESCDFVDSILDAVQEGLVVLDAEFRLQRSNRSFLRTFRLLPEDAANRSLLDLWSGQAHLPQLQKLLEGVRTSNTPAQDVELIHHFPDAGPRVLRLSVRPLAAALQATRLLLLTIDDITERRRAEEDRHNFEVRMFHTQKLESLGVLAGGVAHDLNNLLTPILGFAELARNTLPEHAPAAAMLLTVEKHARQAADLVRQMLAYAGKGRYVVQPTDLSDLVQDMAGLLTTVVSSKAELHFDLASSLPPVDADGTQLQQVVLNLVTNASEALGKRSGRITVRTGVLDITEGQFRAPQSGKPLPAGRYVVLTVADTGCGMTQDVLARAFEPFFSTKFTGRGLGLAAVQGIVEAHGGAITIQSENERGSTVRVFFPCAEPASRAPVAATPAQENGCRGPGTILVLDDEAGVRALAVQTLEEAGFTVLQACDGPEGIETFRARQPEICAVLLDLTMPRMSGLEALEALRGLQPDVRVVLMSGYSIEEVAARYTGKGLAGFVQKPFDRGTLRTAVRQALASVQAPGP